MTIFVKNLDQILQEACLQVITLCVCVCVCVCVCEREREREKQRNRRFYFGGALWPFVCMYLFLREILFLRIPSPPLLQFSITPKTTPPSPSPSPLSFISQDSQTTKQDPLSSFGYSRRCGLRCPEILENSCFMTRLIIVSTSLFMLFQE